MSLRPGANVVPGVTFIRPLGPSMVDSATHVQEPSGLRLKPLCIAVIYRPLLLLALTWARQDDAPVWLVPPVRHCRHPASAFVTISATSLESPSASRMRSSCALALARLAASNLFQRSKPRAMRAA